MSADFDEAHALFVAGIDDFEAARYAEAEKKFTASLTRLPGRPSTIANLAATQIRLGRPAEALRTLEGIAPADAANPEPWRHRGEALHQLGRYDEALACYDKVLAVEPDSTAAWYHRAAALDALRQHEPTLDALERVLALEATNAEAWLRHGQTLQRLERLDPAIASYDKAIALDRNFVIAWTCRGSLLKDIGRSDEAAGCFREALARGGDAEINRYLLASVIGADTPLAAPKAYVEELFDDYASEFDEHLVGVLRYQGHDLLIAHLRKLMGREFRHALDLGCGTGLCGKLICGLADEVTGVDLSQRMLDRAAALGIYRSLIHGDVVEFLEGTDGHHDLVVAADVFIYIGDLERVFGGVRRVLEPGGIFCFSTERADDDKDFELRTSLRYGQSERYVRRLAAQHGFEVLDVLQRPLRDDKQQSIEGLYAYLSA